MKRRRAKTRTNPTKRRGAEKERTYRKTETTISDMHRMIVEESPQVDIGMTGRVIQTQR